MNKILQLFNKQYIFDLFNEKVLPKYPEYQKICSIKTKSYKYGVWEETYHVVIEFSTIFLDKNGKKIKLPIFCSAHSNEPRKNVYTALKFLWNNDFNKGYLTIPQPLFYSNYFRATFYRGVRGDNLYHFIRNNDIDEIEIIIKRAAQWFAKLHLLPTEKAKNFNKNNSRIETIFPGIKNVLDRIKWQYPEYLDFYKQAYKVIIDQENNFLNNTKKRYLIHGDAHPENVIKAGKEKVGIIDFTDCCLADFARDLGTFLQQFRYMCHQNIKDKVFIDKMEKLFLNNYIQKSKVDLNDEVWERINNYYNYTAMRTATYFLIKEKPHPKRSMVLISEICENLNINF